MLSTKWNKTTYGRLYRFKTEVHPNPKFHYCVGGDCSSGLPNRDKAAYQVLCLETHEQVACFGAECPPHQFAVELQKISTFFNNAILGVELDKYGFLTVNLLKDLYNNLYFHTQSATSYEVNISKEYGWKPTSTNRQMALDFLKMDFSANDSDNEAEKSKAIKIYDARTYDEMAFFVKDRETGKEAAQRNKKDDLLAALWICNFIWHESQFRTEFMAEPEIQPKSIYDLLKERKDGKSEKRGFGPRDLVPEW